MPLVALPPLNVVIHSSDSFINMDKLVSQHEYVIDNIPSKVSVEWNYLSILKLGLHRWILEMDM